MRHTRLYILTFLLMALVALGIPAPAQASTQGTPDDDNHPNVGFLLYYADDGFRYRCSGTLVSSNVVLTAAHCTQPVVGKVLVTFDSVIAEQPPTGLPEADPASGYTQSQLESAGYNSGDADSHPKYSGFTDLKNWNDVGVVVLDQTPDVAPAPVAAEGTLDAIAQSELSKTIFTAVGYGKEVRKSDVGPQRPTPEDFPLLRRYVYIKGQKLTPQILQTNGSTTNGKDTGSTCFGDSGGPVFLAGQVVAVTSYGLNDVCRGVSGYQRVDIKGVLDWLATAYGVTPAA